MITLPPDTGTPQLPALLHNAMGIRARRAAARLLAPALMLAATGIMVPATPATAATIIQTFTAGANQPFTVPVGITSLSITATGESGGRPVRGNANSVGGTGSVVSAMLAVGQGEPVEPGSTLYVNVAVGGGPAGVAPGRPDLTGGAGGGASDVRTCSSEASGCVLTGNADNDPRLIVAAGGGGGSLSAAGGAAGFPEGQAAVRGPGSTLAQAGGGGTQTAGGEGGERCNDQPGTEDGESGTAGAGGKGADGPFPASGGGAGWFGGGGGGSCNCCGTGGGGGGSDFLPPGGSRQAASGPAQVVVSYTVADLEITTA
uniref:glycine-rich protein n=1 Tax=Streptomyces sp. NRRL F-2664 TaxID=1463842 RepID=UPI003B63A55D